MKQFLLFILLLTCCKISYAQQKEIDSLQNIIAQSRHDTNEVNALWKTGILKYLNVGNYDSALIYYNQSLKLAKKLDYKKGIGACQNNIGVAYFYKSDYPNALKYYFKALTTREELDDKKGIGYSYGNIGTVYHYQNNYPKALEYYLKAKKIFEKFDDKQSLGTCYNNLGTVYHDLNNYPKALDYYLKATGIFEEVSDKQSVIGCYIGIGNIYHDQNSYTKSLEYYLKAIDLCEKIGDKLSIESCYVNLSSLYNKLNEPKKALAYADSALLISHKTSDINKERLAYKYLAEAHSKLGNYKAAFEAHIKFKTLTDSIFNQENSKQLGDLKTNFEVEKKEAELKADQEKKDLIVNEEKKKQKIVLFAVSFFLFLVAVFSVFMYRRFKLTQKQKLIIEQKEQETQKQKTIVEQQKHLVEEKQKEILDSITYAKRLQQAILPPQEFIDKHVANNFVLYKPKDIVAGDFYWAEVRNNLFFIAAADSTGHGVPGAMVSVVCSNALNRSVKEFGLTDTGKILDKTRELVIETFEKSASEVKDGMDISLLCIDHQLKKIFWSGANNPLWYIEDNELKEIKADKQPVGKTYDTKPFTTNSIDYKSDMTFYLFTDGLADQFGGAHGKKFKYKQFEQLLILINGKSMQKQCEIINQAFEDWKKDLEQVDDVCVIGIKI